MQVTTEYQLITTCDPHAGFCAYITYALNGTRVALDCGRVPVVCFDNSVNNHFFDPERGSNMWEYYFEPVAGVSSSDLDRLAVPPGCIHRFTVEEMGRMHHHDCDRIATFWAHDVPADPAAWMQGKRKLGREYVRKFVRPQKHILQQVDDFHQKHLAGRYAVGVHIRGTDFAYATPTGYGQYRDAIRSHLKTRGIDDYRIFLATDQIQFVDLMSADFPERVVYLDCLRSAGDVAPFKLEGGPGPYRRGEEVLLDVLLMARCDYLFKGAAAGGEYALWFGPHLECTDFALESRFDPRPLDLLEPAHAKLNVSGEPPVRFAVSRAGRSLLNQLSFLKYRLHRAAKSRGRQSADRT